jgi:hypothetical protein
MLRKGEVVISDHNYRDFINPRIDGEVKVCGTVPRDWSVKHPHVMEAVDMPVIDPSEWDARYDEMVATKSFLSDIRMSGNNGQMIPALDQDGKGYCWAHSSTSATMMLRAVQGQPYVGLSAFAIACIIKKYRDEGGWGAQSLDFITEKGVPSAQFWPMQSMEKANDNPQTWENAKLHRVTEGWVDLQAEQYDRALTWNQVMTCLFCRVPVQVDFNWWSHSVCAIDPVRVSRGNWGIRILNSWGDGWSDHGMGVLEGSKAHPDSSTAPRVTIASNV